MIDVLPQPKPGSGAGGRAHRRLACAALAGLFLAAANGLALAETLSVGVDEAKLQRLERDAATVIVGNPLIADVAVHDTSFLVVTGKTYGTTNMIVLDASGKEIASYDVNVTTSGSHAVTLHRGAARVSYTCAPRCERELDVGDAAEGFEIIKKQINDKMGLSRSSGGGGGPQ